ncbi:enolase C-terminal domain-like protein [Lentilactobacillus hilgardii]|uniref:enolase C-terminal domain-like protein n=1 Tax=Lentilactobacillus hilgardii TaxID=1588 RepID=UPI0039E9C00B
MISSPTIEKFEVIPVAGYDSMLLTLSGAHAPLFTRNIVILTDSNGREGIGEIHGGEQIRKSLVKVQSLVVGQKLVNYRNIMNTIREASKTYHGNNDGEGIQELNISNLQYVVHFEIAIECALLDLYGQWVGLPMCDIIGSGRKRDSVEMLGYLFYVGNASKAPGNQYITENDLGDKWGEIRRREILTPEGIVNEASVLKEKYGFRSFKLKGGVLSGEKEMAAIDALHEMFPECHINIDPNGAWSLDQAIQLVNHHQQSLSYVEDPCGAESGFSGREILSFFKNQTNVPVATNMVATDWRQFYPATLLKAVDIVLADPHFWGIEGALRMSEILQSQMLSWGSHSNNHFDITLALFAQVGAAASGTVMPLDTHWIWQDGQNLCGDALQIKNGQIKIPGKPGLGIHADRNRLNEAHALYCQMKSHDRNDALFMKYLVPGWTFNPKKPALVHQ